jgi:Domain of unknown function (DUF4390)
VVRRRQALVALAVSALAGPLSRSWAGSVGVIELVRLDLARIEQGLQLEFDARFELPAGVEDALQKGVALHFLATCDVMRSRWYWRDKRLASATRTWRLTYQPLTFSYRVSLGGLSQTYLTLREALRAVQRLSQWRIAEGGDADDAEYIDFSYRLDVDQLPRPLLITLGDQPEWSLRVQRTMPTPPVAR